MAASAAAGSAHDGVAQVRISLHTRQSKYRVPDAVMSVPANLQRKQLSQLVNHILETQDRPTPFDFTIDGVLLRTTLNRLLGQLGRSLESVAEIQYFAATPPPKPVEKPALRARDWITAVSGAEVALWATGKGGAGYLVAAGDGGGSMTLRIATAGELRSGAAEAAAAEPQALRVRAHWRGISAVAAAWSEGMARATAVTGGRDAVVRVWGVDRSDGPGSVAAAQPVATSTQWQPTEQQADEEADEGEAAAVAAVPSHSASVLACSLSAGAQRLASADAEGRVLVWDMPTPDEDLEAEGGDGGSDEEADAGRAGRRRRRGSAGGAGSGQKRRRGGSAGAGEVGAAAPAVQACLRPRLAVWEGDGRPTNGLAWVSDALLLAGGGDRCLRVFDIEREDLKRERGDDEAEATAIGGLTATDIRLAGKAITSLAASPGGGLAVTAHPDHLLRLWDLRANPSEGAVAEGSGNRGQCTRMSGHSAWVGSVAWSPASSHLVSSASQDGSVRLWDIRATSPMHRLATHEGRALCCSWLGDRFVASGGEDKHVKVAELEHAEDEA